MHLQGLPGFFRCPDTFRTYIEYSGVCIHLQKLPLSGVPIHHEREPLLHHLRGSHEHSGAPAPLHLSSIHDLSMSIYQVSSGTFYEQLRTLGPQFIPEIDFKSIIAMGSHFLFTKLLYDLA